VHAVNRVGGLSEKWVFEKGGRAVYDPVHDAKCDLLGRHSLVVLDDGFKVALGVGKPNELKWTPEIGPVVKV
jgi:hypothetical protein